MKKSYEQQQTDLHEKSLELFQQAEQKHVRLMEIEEKIDELKDENIDYGDEHFELLMDLAYLMREQVDISLQSDVLKMNKLERIRIPKESKPQKH